MAVGVDRIIVVTTIVLPLETERNVDGDSEGVGIAFGCEVKEDVEEDVEDGGELALDVVDEDTELDDDESVGLDTGVLV